MNLRFVFCLVCSLVLLGLLLAACGADVVSPSPTAAPLVAVAPPSSPTVPPTVIPTPLPATATSTPVPLTATPTPVPPTPTATPTTPPPTVTPTATPSATVAPDVVVTAPRLNVRSGPGTGYPILATASKGDTLVVEGQNDDCAWLQVATAQGVDGWVSGAPDYAVLNVSSAGIAQGDFAPLPIATTGRVYGRLVPGSSGKSVANRRMVLASAQVDGDRVTMTFQGEQDLAATTNASGSFEFRAVPPGHYVLTFGSSWDMGFMRTDDGAIIVIVVDAGDDVDLGRIVWN